MREGLEGKCLLDWTVVNGGRWGPLRTGRVHEIAITNRLSRLEESETTKTVFVTNHLLLYCSTLLSSSSYACGILLSSRFYCWPSVICGRLQAHIRSCSTRCSVPIKYLCANHLLKLNYMRSTQ